ncbi:MAG: (deoxy)nucleoside triphosphate pyrophosphohydrolase [Deltaproteobacteria bacterium]|jgi:8-oxo-dGTP diphosphatase|nr:(deoxy)nucleoside triphosphate pyrophosphohydrolase [Deltaproteobacteria bacterium]MBW2480807.1 (deoxy)nucleoside triphosphate pyrophosphohydrolase [Deltaproteobacteria bacterium]
MQKVTAAILVKDDKILIARRKETDRQGGKWEFPGGKIKGNETPHECLIREMKEEFGIDVWVGKFFAESTYRYGHGKIRLLAYLTSWIDGQLTLNAHADGRWVYPSQLDDFDFAPADIPLVEKLQRTDQDKP